MGYASKVRKPGPTTYQRLTKIVQLTHDLRTKNWWWMRWLCLGILVDLREIERIADAMRNNIAREEVVSGIRKQS